jgi:hypothetical protein
LDNTADHVIVTLRDNVQKLSDLTAARLDAVSDATLERINDLGTHVNGHITETNETDARLVKVEAPSPLIASRAPTPQC